MKKVGYIKCISIMLILIFNLLFFNAYSLPALALEDTLFDIPPSKNGLYKIVTSTFDEVRFGLNWGDKLFEGDAVTDDWNTDLATIAMALSWSAERSQSDINSLLDSLGFEKGPLRYNNHYDVLANLNHPALTIASQNIRVHNTSKTLISVVLRGTTSDTLDWLTDVTSLANGFLPSGENTKSELAAYMQEHYPTNTPDNTIFFITGHSLGAATAGVLARTIGDMAYNNDIYCYLFATPNFETGGEEVQTYNYHNIYNFINVDDWVPEVPPNFTRVGNSVLFDYASLDGSGQNRVDNYYKTLTGSNIAYSETNSQKAFSNFERHISAAYMSLLLNSIDQNPPASLSIRYTFTGISSVEVLDGKQREAFVNDENKSCNTDTVSARYANNAASIVVTGEKTYTFRFVISKKYNVSLSAYVTSSPEPVAHAKFEYNQYKYFTKHMVDNGTILSISFSVTDFDDSRAPILYALDENGKKTQWIRPDGVIAEVLREGEDDESALIIDNGAYDGGITWKLDSEGVLTIGGQGTIGIDYPTSYNPVSEVIPETLDWEAPWIHSSLSQIKTVVILDGITKIGGDAFHGCNELIDITIPNSVTSIETFAFYGCEKLEDILIPDSVTYIGDAAFMVSGLKSVTLPDGVLTIGNHAFDCCYHLESITLPNSIAKIGNEAFRYCVSLKSITLPSSVSDIGFGVFRHCEQMTNVILSEGIMTISGAEFDECTSLVSVTIPDSVRKIGSYAFHNCTSLENLIIPEGVSQIGSEAFYHCTSLNNVYLPDSIEVIEYSAFYDCISLSSIRISPRLTCISSGLFDCCRCLNNVVIPNGVTSIDGDAFSNCDGLRCIFIPNSIVSIASDAFRYCYSVEDVFYEGTEDEWQTVFSQNRLEWTIIRRATVHYNCRGIEFNTETSIINTSINGSSVDTMISVASNITTPSAWIAFYNENGQFLGVNVFDLASGENSLSCNIPGNAVQIKVMVLNEYFGPLCQPVTVYAR